MARKSGSMRVLVKLTSDSKVMSRKVRLKSAKNLYLSHRFFDKIRQIYRFFYIFRQKLQILCRNKARSIQALQVGYFSRRDELLVMCSGLLAARHAPHLANFSPCALRTVKRTVGHALERATRHASERSPHAEKSPPHLQFLNNI